MENLSVICLLHCYRRRRFKQIRSILTVIVIFPAPNTLLLGNKEYIFSVRVAATRIPEYYMMRCYLYLLFSFILLTLNIGNKTKQNNIVNKDFTLG